MRCTLLKRIKLWVKPQTTNAGWTNFKQHYVKYIRLNLIYYYHENSKLLSTATCYSLEFSPHQRPAKIRRVASHSKSRSRQLRRRPSTILTVKYTYGAAGTLDRARWITSVSIHAHTNRKKRMWKPFSVIVGQTFVRSVCTGTIFGSVIRFGVKSFLMKKTWKMCVIKMCICMYMISHSCDLAFLHNFICVFLKLQHFD